MFYRQAKAETFMNEARPELKAAEPPTKRAKVESDVGTDSEIEAFTEAPSNDDAEFQMYRVRKGGAWLVIPQNVEEVVLEAFSKRMEAAGWKSLSQAARCEKFSAGSSD